MLNKIFEENFKNTYNYFKTLIQNKAHFPQSIVFEGSDIWGQYFFSLELARILNCENPNDENCTCINCKWIKEGCHNSVLVYSPIDNKGEDDGTSVVISAKQIDEIVKNLSYKNEFHRFFIFTGAKKGECNGYLKKQYKKYENLGYYTKENWVPEFLDTKIFRQEAVNKFLKSIEEPPENTTFVFLTRNKEDLLQTVVSRSFVFKMPEKPHYFEYEKIKEIFRKYPNIELDDIIDIDQNIQNYITESEIKDIEFLNQLEQFLGDLYIQNPNNTKIKRDLKTINESKKYIKASIKPQYVYENLIISLAK